MSTAKLKKDALKQLQVKPHSLTELAATMELKEKRVFRLLRSLFEAGEITAKRNAEGVRIYRPKTDEEKAAAKATAKAAEAGEEVEVDEDEEDEEE